MTTPGRLHLIATFALVLMLASVSLAQAGLYDTPTNGWGIDSPPQPVDRGLGRGLTGR